MFLINVFKFFKYNFFFLKVWLVIILNFLQPPKSFLPWASVLIEVIPSSGENCKR